ncbi:unnamed protein product [Agarophyton chilense]
MASDSAPPSPTTQAASAQKPPRIEHFMLKDLDTGMKSYVTDHDWVEKPTVPAVGMALSQPVVHLKQQSIPPNSRRPPVPPPIARPRPSLQKRARSDELQGVYRTLRPSDHVRVIVHRKRERDRRFGNLYRWQRVAAHNGAIRVIEFNKLGTYLASAGQDTLIKLWDIDCYLQDSRAIVMKTFDAPQPSASSNPRVHSAYTYIRRSAPAAIFKGHTSDITAMSWSKNDFLLSASMDKTIRLWHPKSKACLRRLLHDDYVTCVAFHPTDEQICISGMANGTVSMWHLKERKALCEAETDDLITACAITPDGTTALVGTNRGRCKFYGLFDEIQGEWQFKHTTQLDVRSRRAKNAQGKKICGFRFYGKSDKVIVSSNDSRLRLYRLDDKSILAKFLGHQNNKSRLTASFAPGGRYVLCGSEDKMVYIWEVDYSLYRVPEAVGRTMKKPVHEDESSSQKRKDTGNAYEYFGVQDGGEITAAVFAPKMVPERALSARSAFSKSVTSGLVIVTASNDGFLFVFGCC